MAPGPACYCGRRGCIETFLSGPGLANEHLRQTGESADAASSGVGAEAGDPACQRTLDIYGDRLARALAMVINILDPDVVVLGGGMSNLPELAPAVFTLLPRYVFSDTVQTQVVPNLHGDSSGVRGAAWLWPM